MAEASEKARPLGLNWRLRAADLLRGRAAQRVLTFNSFTRMLAIAKPGISYVTTRRVLDEFVRAGYLRKVAANIYLNQLAVPPAVMNEAAASVRAGAVVSLHSVLGEYGVTNNPSAIVTAVIPLERRGSPSLGEHRTNHGAAFHFYGLPERFFPPAAGAPADLYIIGRPYPIFRPEKALLDWLYLGASPRSRLTPPPVDVDLDQLDSRLLKRLAKSLVLEDLLNRYVARCHQSDFGEERMEAPAHRPAPKM
jgi:hypothetical protein